MLSHAGSSWQNQLKQVWIFPIFSESFEMNLKLVNEFKDSLSDYQKKEIEKLIEIFGKKILIKV